MKRRSPIANKCLIFLSNQILKTKKFNHIPFDCFYPRIPVKPDSLFTDIEVYVFSSFKFHAQLFFLNLNKLVFLSKFSINCLILKHTDRQNEKNSIRLTYFISTNFICMRKRRRKPILRSHS